MHLLYSCAYLVALLSTKQDKCQERKGRVQKKVFLMLLYFCNAGLQCSGGEVNQDSIIFSTQRGISRLQHQAVARNKSLSNCFTPVAWQPLLHKTALYKTPVPSLLRTCKKCSLAYLPQIKLKQYHYPNKQTLERFTNSRKPWPNISRPIPLNLW